MYPTHSEAKLKHQFRAEKGSLQDQGREYGGGLCSEDSELGSTWQSSGYDSRLPLQGHRFDLWLGH